MKNKCGVCGWMDGWVDVSDCAQGNSTVRNAACVALHSNICYLRRRQTTDMIIEDLKKYLCMLYMWPLYAYLPIIIITHKYIYAYLKKRPPWVLSYYRKIIMMCSVKIYYTKVKNNTCQFF